MHRRPLPLPPHNQHTFACMQSPVPDPGDVIRNGSDGRLRFTPEQQDSILAAFNRCGVSAMAFARQHGLNYQTFISWLRKRREGRDRPTSMRCYPKSGPQRTARTTPPPEIPRTCTPPDRTTRRVHLDPTAVVRGLTPPSLRFPEGPEAINRRAVTSAALGTCAHVTRPARPTPLPQPAPRDFPAPSSRPGITRTTFASPPQSPRPPRPPQPRIATTPPTQRAHPQARFGSARARGSPPAKSARARPTTDSCEARSPAIFGIRRGFVISRPQLYVV